MKHILLIFSLVLIISFGVGYVVMQSFNGGMDEENIALKINDRIISKDELEQRYKYRPDHLSKKSDFLDAMISKELLIQEAQKLRIDQNEGFRHSIQNFYEQSLIKLLMDRKMDSIKIDIDDATIDRYIYLLGKNVKFTLWRLDSLEGIGEEPQLEELPNRSEQLAQFQDLSLTLKCIITSLEEGEASTPYLIDSHAAEAHYVLVQLNRILPLDETASAVIDRERIKVQLASFQQQKTIANWEKELKDSAEIKFYVEPYQF